MASPWISCPVKNKKPSRGKAGTVVDIMDGDGEPDSDLLLEYTDIDTRVDQVEDMIDKVFGALVDAGILDYDDIHTGPTKWLVDGREVRERNKIVYVTNIVKEGNFGRVMCIQLPNLLDTLQFMKMNNTISAHTRPSCLNPVCSMGTYNLSSLILQVDENYIPVVLDEAGNVSVFDPATGVETFNAFETRIDSSFSPVIAVYSLATH